MTGDTSVVDELGGQETDLSPAARSVWAKSTRDEVGRVVEWLPLWQHLDDAAAVAGWLWDHWLPISVRRVVAAGLPDLGHGRTLAIWLASMHDIGKATPAFAVQVPCLADRMREHGLTCDRGFVEADRRHGRHAVAGHVVLLEWLEARQWDRRSAGSLAVVVGGHHGIPPEAGEVRTLPHYPHLLGDCAWQAIRREILDRQCRRWAGDVLDSVKEIRLTQPTQVALSSIVTLADWIASNDYYFPFTRFPNEVTSASPDRVAQAVGRLDLPPPWHAVPPNAPTGALLLERFRLNESVVVRPVQEDSVAMANRMNGTGLIVIEAPMGEGKTEAALLAAEVLAAKSGAGGVFVGLPTQATANAMFDRLVPWIRGVPDAGGNGRRATWLAHGKASLQPGFRQMRIEGRFRAVESDAGATGGRHQNPDKPPTVVVDDWLAGRKKGVLASFVAGSIDQLLFMGLKAKYLSLRHLAMAGKVVVIDEAHAYDVYMSTYMDRVLEWLGAWQVPVIVLSATLPSSRRREMLEAYEKGAGSRPVTTEDSGTISYPRISATTGSERLNLFPQPSRSEMPVRLALLSDDLDALIAELDPVLGQGACVAVIRNTVRRAQETARALESRFGEERVTLAHSRFLACDRARIDDALLRRFGPPDGGSVRPWGHAVVATQVIEQSLDVDFDLLITDVAPVDLLLQRIGRMHRHDRGERPESVREPRCVITGVIDRENDPPDIERGTRHVYDGHLLLRTLAAIRTHLHSSGAPLRIPTDIAPLVEQVYALDPEEAPIGPDGWQSAMRDAARVSRQGRDRRVFEAGAFLLGEVREPGRPIVGWLYAGVGEVDESATGLAQVRDGEESLEVIVVQRDDRGDIAIPGWIPGRSGEPVPTDSVLAVTQDQAGVLAECTVRLPAALCRGSRIDRAIRELESNFFPAWQTSPLLRGQLVLVLDSDGRCRLAGAELKYDPRYGLEMIEHG